MIYARDRQTFLSTFRAIHHNTIFIAEVKTESQLSGWKSSDTWETLLELAGTYGDWVAIHTDPRWGGSFDKVRIAHNELIRRYREQERPKILAKGIHASDADIWRALSEGADYVLVVVGPDRPLPKIPYSSLNKLLIEPASIAGLATIPHGLKAVWNARDLQAALGAYERGEKLPHNTGKRETFEDARIVWSGWLCQASNINTISDIRSDADAILVGTHLKSFVESVR